MQRLSKLQKRLTAFLPVLTKVFLCHYCFHYTKGCLTFWCRNYFFSFSTLCILNVNNTGTKHVRIMKQTAFWRERKRRVSTSQKTLTFWRRNYIFNFNTPVYKMWIIQEPNTFELWNKLHFEEKETESIYISEDLNTFWFTNKVKREKEWKNRIENKEKRRMKANCK